MDENDIDSKICYKGVIIYRKDANLSEKEKEALEKILTTTVQVTPEDEEEYKVKNPPVIPGSYSSNTHTEDIYLDKIVKEVNRQNDIKSGVIVLVEEVTYVNSKDLLDKIATAVGILNFYEPKKAK